MLGSRQKAEYLAGPVETLQLSVGGHHSIVTEASRGEVKASVPARQAYKCVKPIAVTAIIYFFAGRITLDMLCATSARRFIVIRIVANDNDTLVGALSSELAPSTSGKCVTVDTGRVRDVWTSGVQGHRRQVPMVVGKYVSIR